MQRYIPLSPITASGLHLLPETAGYRLAIHAIEGLPTQFLVPETLQLRVTISLYNQSSGHFVGNTVHSSILKHGFRPSQRLHEVDVEVALEAYFHTRVFDRHLVAVAEICLVEMTMEGVAAREWALGWATVPLFDKAAHGVQMMSGDHGHPAWRSPWTSPEGQGVARGTRASVRGLYKAPVMQGSVLQAQAGGHSIMGGCGCRGVLTQQGWVPTALPVMAPSEGCMLLCQVFIIYIMLLGDVGCGLCIMGVTCVWSMSSPT